MYNHAPEEYVCPFCLLVKGIENEKVLSKQADIFYKDEYVTAFIAAHSWPNNPGHVLIIPNRHFENIYDIDEQTLEKIHIFSKKIALALKDVYACEGVSIRQHNEPCGNQDVWHYHLHLFPRYKNDHLYILHEEKKLMAPEERKVYAEKLKQYFKNNQ